MSPRDDRGARLILGDRAGTRLQLRDFLFFDTATTATIQGVIAGIGSVSGVLTIERPLGGLGVVSQSGVSGALTADRRMSGTITGAGSVAGALRVDRIISGAISGSSSVVVTLTVDGGDTIVSGAVSGVGSVTVALRVEKAVSGTVAGVGAISGSLLVDRIIGGSIAGVGVVSGSLRADRILSGTISGVGAVSGMLASDAATIANYVRRLRRWGATKPPVGTQIDWSHPLTHGMGVCMPMNEGGGLPTNLVTGHRATGTGGTWSPLGGGGYDMPAGVGKLTLASAPFGVADGNTYTLAVLATIRALDTTGTILLGVNGASYFQIQLSGTQFHMNVASVPVSPAVSWTDRKPKMVVVRVVAGAGTVWVDGVQRASGTAWNIGTGLKSLILGGWTGGANWDLDGALNSVWTWDRALSAAEIMQHTAAPYDMMRPR